MNTIKKIVTGYSELIKKGASSILTPVKIVIFLGVIFGLSLAIVYPLWTFANYDKVLYSNFVIIFILTLFVFFILYKAIRYIYFNSFKKLFTEILFPQIKKILKFVFVGAYSIATIYLLNYSIIYGLISIFVAIVIIGYVKFGFKKS